MLTEIENGKRVVIQSPRIEFKSPEALLEILTQIFQEFKIASQHCISNAREARYFSLMAKSGKNRISVDTHMVNTYPDLVLAINNYNIFRWNYKYVVTKFPQFERAEFCWVRQDNTGTNLSLNEVLNEIMDSVRKEWSNH